MMLGTLSNRNFYILLRFEPHSNNIRDFLNANHIYCRRETSMQACCLNEHSPLSVLTQLYVMSTPSIFPRLSPHPTMTKLSLHGGRALEQGLRLGHSQLCMQWCGWK